MEVLAVDFSRKKLGLPLGFKWQEFRVTFSTIFGKKGKERQEDCGDFGPFSEEAHLTASRLLSAFSS